MPARCSDALGQRNRRIVSRLYDHALDQGVDRHTCADLHKGARALGRQACSLMRICSSIFSRPSAGHQTPRSRHQFGQACRLEPLVGIGAGQNLSRDKIHQDIGLGIDRRRVGYRRGG